MKTGDVTRVKARSPANLRHVLDDSPEFGWAASIPQRRCRRRPRPCTKRRRKTADAEERISRYCSGARHDTAQGKNTNTRQTKVAFFCSCARCRLDIVRRFARAVRPAPRRATADKPRGAQRGGGGGGEKEGLLLPGCTRRSAPSTAAVLESCRQHRDLELSSCINGRHERDRA